MRIAEAHIDNPPPAAHADIQRRALPRAGFSLVEVVVALLVMVVGLLSIMALLPVGLDSSRDARNNTHMAQFASRVFNGILAQTMSDPDLWSNIYAGVGSITCSVAPDSESLWSSEPDLMVILNDTKINTFVAKDDTNITEYAYRYSLTSEKLQPMRWDVRYAEAEGRATWPIASGWDPKLQKKVVTNTTEWWVCPILYDDYRLRYRRSIVRLKLTIYPELYGNSNMRTFYTYLPRLM